MTPGIRVAYGGIDGGVDGDRLKGLFQQPRSAWTHELDVRPWVESR